MTPGLLLDALLSHALTAELVRHGVDAVHIATWQAGRWRTADDESLLRVATIHERVLVSLDAATLPDIARLWVEEQREHAGLLILSARISQSDVGGQLKAIHNALDAMHDQTWVNQTYFARRS